jgi:hypothetical protein
MLFCHNARLDHALPYLYGPRIKFWARNRVIGVLHQDIIEPGRSAPRRCDFRKAPRWSMLRQNNFSSPANSVKMQKMRLYALGMAFPEQFFMIDRLLHLARAYAVIPPTILLFSSPAPLFTRFLLGLARRQQLSFKMWGPGAHDHRTETKVFTRKINVNAVGLVSINAFQGIAPSFQINGDLRFSIKFSF